METKFLSLRSKEKEASVTPYCPLILGDKDKVGSVRGGKNQLTEIGGS